MRILVLDGPAGSSRSYLRDVALAGCEVTLSTSPEEALEEIGDAEILLVWDKDPYVGSMPGILERGNALRWLHSAYVGLDGITDECERSLEGVRVTAGGDVFAQSMAEFACAYILQAIKGFDVLRRQQAEKRWRAFATPRFAEITVGVLGVGNVGRRLLAMLANLGIRTRGFVNRHSPVVRTPRGDLVEMIHHGELARTAPMLDFLVITAPLTEDTRGMVSRTLLELMKPGSRVVNIARSEILDVDALLERTASGDSGGGLLDVFADEPLRPDSPLWECPEILVSPHMSGDHAGDDDASWERFRSLLDEYRSKRTKNLRCAGEPARQ